MSKIQSSSTRQGVVATPKCISEYKLRDEQVFSGPARLIFENGVQWKEWEKVSVMELKSALGDDNTWSDGDLLRYIHLAGSYRYHGVSPTDYTLEDILTAKELLQNSRSWKNANRPTWSPEVRKAFASHCFYQGRDKRGRPLVIVRLEGALDGDGEDLKRAIYRLIDEDIEQRIIPGVAEQGVWIIDLAGVKLSYFRKFASSFQGFGKDLELNWPCRGANFYVLNLPWVVNAAAQAIMLFALKETKEKFQFFNKTFEQHPQLMTKIFDAEYLPVEYGGDAIMMCHVESVTSSVPYSNVPTCDSVSVAAVDPTPRSHWRCASTADHSMPHPQNSKSFSHDGNLLSQILTQVRSGKLPSADLHQLRRDLDDYLGGSSRIQGFWEPTTSGSFQRQIAAVPDLDLPKGVYVSYCEMLLGVLSLVLGTALTITIMRTEETCA